MGRRWRFLWAVVLFFFLTGQVAAALTVEVDLPKSGSDYFTNQQEVEIGGVTVPNGVVRVTVGSSSTVLETNGDEEGRFRFVVSLGNGSNTLRFIDEGGTVLLRVYVTVDANPPTITNLNPSPDQYLQVGNPVISYNIEDTRELDLDSFYIVLNDETEVHQRITVTSKKKYQIRTQAPLNLNEGQHHVRVGGRDLAGNLAEVEYMFTVDKTDPIIVSLEPTDGSLHNRGETAFRVVVDDDNPSTVKVDSTLLQREEGGLFVGMVSLPQEGENLMVIEVEDKSRRKTTATMILVRDTLPPGFTLSEVPNELGVGEVILLDVSVNEPLVGAPWLTVIPGDLNFYPLEIDDNVWGFIIDTEGWAGGTYTMRVEGEDLAGNRGEKEVSFILTSPEPPGDGPIEQPGGPIDPESPSDSDTPNQGSTPPSSDGGSPGPSETNPPEEGWMEVDESSLDGYWGKDIISTIINQGGQWAIPWVQLGLEGGVRGEELVLVKDLPEVGGLLFPLQGYDQITRMDILSTLLAGQSHDLDRTDHPFQDCLKLSQAEQKCLYFAYHLGIIAGYPDGSFRPYQPLTRGELVLLVHRYLQWINR